MNNDLEQFSEERLKDLMNVSMDINVRFSDADIISLARIALSAKQAKPVGVFYPTAFYIKGKYKLFTIDEAKHSGIIRNGVLNESYSYIYTTPQPAHTEQSEMLNKASSLSESIGELRKQIDSSGGYDFEALRSEQVNSPVIPDGWRLVPIEPTEAMKKAYYDSSLAPISKLSVTGYRALIAAAPKPESE